MDVIINKKNVFYFLMFSFLWVISSSLKNKTKHTYKS